MCCTCEVSDRGQILMNFKRVRDIQGKIQRPICLLQAGLELVSLISVTGNFIWLIVWLIICDGTVTSLIELADRKWMIGKPKV